MKGVPFGSLWSFVDPQVFHLHPWVARPNLFDRACLARSIAQEDTLKLRLGVPPIYWTTLCLLRGFLCGPRSVSLVLCELCLAACLCEAGACCKRKQGVAGHVFRIDHPLHPRACTTLNPGPDIEISDFFVKRRIKLPQRRFRNISRWILHPELFQQVKYINTVVRTKQTIPFLNRL